MNSDTRNQFQLPDSQFSGSGNQSFLSQAAYQSFPNNMGMLPQQVQYSNMMSPMQQQNPLPDSNSSTQHLGMQSMNGMQQFQFPGQMNAHLLQSQASQLLNSNQFRPAQDWRSMLSAPDRQHVINQLYNTISAQIQRAQQGNPNGTHNQGRAEGLARSVEQHIYESANSRVSRTSFVYRTETHSLGKLSTENH
jgi:hypothetical protein